MTNPTDLNVFEQSFTEQQRRVILAEDADAWRHVTGILFAIVMMGVTMGIATVTFICSSTGS